MPIKFYSPKKDIGSAVAVRIFDSAIPEPNSGCWLWAKYLNSDGYGVINVDHHNWVAHRASYIAHRGPIPDGLEIDHKCRVRCCVNPDHLEAVTKVVNVRRSTAADRHKKITHCPKGHPYSGENLYIDKKGRRRCNACGRAASLASYHRRKCK